MNTQAVTPPEQIIFSVAKYYQEIQFAENVMKSGIDDLIVLIYGEKINLGNAANISNEPPAIQRAVCEIARIQSEKISLRDTACEVINSWSSQERRGKIPLVIDDSKLAAHLQTWRKPQKLRRRPCQRCLSCWIKGGC